MSAVGDRGFANALAHLPGIRPPRLRLYLDHGAEAVWRGLIDRGVAPTGPRLPQTEWLDRWRSFARTFDVEASWAGLVARRAALLLPGDDDFPDRFTGRPGAPPLLFRVGRHPALDGPTVTVVGTRRCSIAGAEMAHEIGATLAAEGVTVVSGLALGIDAAAHRGALHAGGSTPVAVVGSGVDQIYPRTNRAVWAAVEAEGAIYSEAPPAARAEPWRFPLRNRLLAALADVVVVVESHERGGSLLTVDAALALGTTVMAVPGPVRQSSCRGSNALLADGAMPLLEPRDVLDALGLDCSTVVVAGASRRCAPGDRAVLDAFGWQPAVFEQIVERTGRPMGDVSRALSRLCDSGAVRREGSWYVPLARARR